MQEISKPCRLICLIYMMIAAIWLFAVPEENPPSGKSAKAVLSTNDYQLIDALLGEIQLSPQDLNFEKDWDLSTQGKSPSLLRALQEPYQGLDLLQNVRETCAAAMDDPGVARLLSRLHNVAAGQREKQEYYLIHHELYTRKWQAEVKKPQDIFRFYEKVLDSLVPVLAGAYSDFNRDDWSLLLAWLHSALMESDDKAGNEAFFAKHGFPKADSLTNDQAAELLNRLQQSKLQEAGLQFLAASQVIREGAGKLNYKNKKALVKKGFYGTMVIGSKADDRYLKNQFSSPVILMLEPGGSDSYELAFNTGWDNYCYLLLDYQGNDSYLNQETGELFYAMSGLGYAVDLQGDDIYRSGNFSFASLMGINIFVDETGNDIYDSGLFSQGASALGLSIMLDKQGRDSYRATGLSQGFGSHLACGALLDFEGADSYETGGKYTHAPLMPNDFRSMGQGMGFGFRPDFAGGLGLLYDGKGNDRYQGGVYAQGVGYWYATGMLIDESGNDVYNAIYYPQGSGIHLACGYLYDGSGDDAYYSRNGPGQGAGHDWGQGILIDGAGNDAYSIQGGNGLGLSNSVGIFVDKAGNDRYERNEAQNYGSGAASRSTGSIGLFLDLGGKDSYPDSTMADGKTWKKGSFGIGRDISAAEGEAPKEEITMLEEPAADAPIAEIFAAASEWEVGSAVNRVKKAREIMLNRAAETTDYVVKNKLSTDSGLEYRALEALAKGNNDFLQKLFEHTNDPDSLKAKNAMSLIAGVGDSTLIVPIKAHLTEKRYITACISLLGSIKSEESVKLLSEYSFHSSERYRYLVARSLRSIDSPSAAKALNDMAGDSSFLVKALIRQWRKEKR